MFSHARLAGAWALMLLLGAPAVASAQSADYFGLLTPHLGITAGGDAQDATLTPGLSVGIFESSGWGAEADIGYARGFDSRRFEESSAATYMVNAAWTMERRARVRPYGVGGAGLIHARTCPEPCVDPVSEVDFGISAGGGVLIAVGDIFFVRGDIRYFHALQAHPEFGFEDGRALRFWRTSVGFSVWWPVW